MDEYEMYGWGYESGSGFDFTPRQRDNWLLIRIPTAVYFVCTAYIAVVLTMEELHRKRKRGDRSVAKWRVARLVAAYVSAFGFFFGGLTLIVEGFAEMTCDTAIKLENACYWLTLSAIYAAIWFRQRVIYENPGIKDITSRFTSCLGYLVGFLVLGLPVMNISLLFTSVRFITFIACEDVDLLGDTRLLILCEVIVPLFLPLSLLLLFVWPFIRHCCSSEGNVLFQRSTKSIIRRMILTAVGCAVTDLIASTTPFLLPIYVRYFAQQTSAFLNLVFLLLSFKNWKIILHPLRHEIVRTQSISSSASTRIHSTNHVQGQRVLKPETEV